MSFGGGGAGGEIRYKIAVDTTEATQKLPAVGQALQQLDQQTQTTSQSMAQMTTVYDDVSVSSDKLTQSQDEASTSIKSGADAAKNAETQHKSFGSVLKNNIANITQIAASVLGLVSNYTSLQRSQLAINKLQVTEANQRRMLDQLTRKHAEAVALYGQNSQEALDIQAKIDILQQKNINTVEQLSLRQDQLNQATIGFGLSIVQTGTSIVQAATGFQTYTQGANAAKVATTGLTMSITKLKVATVIGAILVGIEIAAQAVANNFGGFRDRIEELYNWLVQLAPVFKPVIDAIWTIGQALTALFTGDLDALTKMFGQKAPAALANTTEATDNLAESGKALAKQAKEDEKAWDDYVKKMEEVDTASNKLWHTLEDKGTKALLGLKGLKGFKGLADDVTDTVKSFEGLGSKLLFAFKLPEYDKLFKIPKGTGKKLAQGVSHDLQDIKKALDPEFSKAIGELQEKIKKDGEKGGKKTAEIMAQFFINNPELYRQIKELDYLPPEVISIIESKMSQARAKVDLLIGDAFDPAKQLSTGKTGPLTTGYLKDLTKQALFGTDGGGGEDKKDGGFSAIIKTMTDSLKTLTDALPNTTKLITGLGNSITTAVVATWNSFSSAVTILADWLTELIAPQGWAVFIAGIDDAIVSTWNAFSSSISIIADWLTELIAPQGWAVFIAGVDDAIVSTWNAFSSSITVIADWLTELIAPKGWDVFVKGVDDAIVSTWNSFSSAITVIADWLTELIAPKGWGAFIGTVSDDVNKAWDTWQGILGTISDWLFDLQLPAGWTEFIKTVSDTVATAWKSFSDALAPIATFLNTAKTVGVDVINALTNLFKAKGSSTDIPTIPEKDKNKQGGTSTDINPGVYTPGDGKVYTTTLYYGGAQGTATGNIAAAGSDTLIKQLDASGIKVPPSLRTGNATIDEIFSFLQDPYTWTKKNTNLPQVPQIVPMSMNKVSGYQQGTNLIAGSRFADARFGGAGGPMTPPIKGVGELMAEQTNVYAKIAVGAQQVQKALANLAIQGGNSFRLLANNILKNTQNLSGNFVTIAVRSQIAQKALANLAVQGGNSFRLLANAILRNTANLMGNFTTIAKISQTAQKALANLAIQGGNSFRILANLILKNTSNLLGNFTSINVAAQGSQTALANLANQGANSLAILAKASSKQIQGFIKNLNKGYESAGHLQEGIANLANEGSDSVSVLAKNMAKSMSSITKSVQGAQKAVISLVKSIGNMHSKTITLTVKRVGDWTTQIHQHGFHGIVTGATPFIAGERGPELVNITPMSQMTPSPRSGLMAGGGGGGMAGQIVVNLTNVNFDRETTRTFRRELGKEMYRFGPT